MPITYNEANDIWELTNATQEEKTSLTEIAVEQIVGFFGKEVASRILNSATINGNGREILVNEAELPKESFQTGEVGNS